MAAGKLQEILPQPPLTYRGQNVVTLSRLGVSIALAAYLVRHPGASHLFPLTAGIPLVFGILMVIPIGGADMPTAISLLDPYAGLPAPALGFVQDRKLPILARG